MSTHRFNLVGGHPALDFLNTIHDWTVPQPRDYLADAGAAARFGEAVGLLTRAEARRLRGFAVSGELQQLREMRAGLERTFRAVVTGRAPRAKELDQLSRWAVQAAGAARLRAAGGQVRRVVEVATAGAPALRWRIVEAAVTLLTSPRLDRIKACPSCGWFFLDASKNGSRRWCSMTTCGSSAKSRRYYWRTRKRKRGGTTHD